MNRPNRPVVWLAAMLACTAIARETSAQAPAAPGAELKRSLDQAWKAGQQRRVEKLLTDAFSSEAGAARQVCHGLVTGADTSARPLGAVVLARNLAPRELADLARSLDTSRFPDERRCVVRAIGTRAKNDEDTRPTLALLRPFLQDRDFLVRAAAAAAMADLGRREAVADLAGFIEHVPAYQNSDTINEREIFRRAACGAVRTLTGLRPGSVAEVKQWLAAGNGQGRAARAEHPPPLQSGSWNNQPFTAATGFDLYLRVSGLNEIPRQGPYAIDTLVKYADSGAAAARAALARIAGGPVHESIPRLYLCDTREFSARAGVTFFQGVTKSNEIVIKIDPPAALAGTMAHEYVHWLHQSLYNDQPRWMAEGLATSLSVSTRESIWLRRPPEGEVRKMVERGAFTELFNWNSGGSSDSRESARYAVSHIAIDFLRFGEFSVSEERLAFFMGRIARKESPTRALGATYGRDSKEMDRALAAWLSSAPK